MKKIILHIGTHKTGSTSIQNALVLNRDLLQAHGVLYGATDRPPNAHLRKQSSLAAAVLAGDEEFEAERREILSEFEASGCHTLILSDEAFFNSQGAVLDRFRALTEGYETEVVCFLRRQDQFVESLWNQGIKNGKETETIDKYCQRKHVQKRNRYDRILIDGWQSFARVRAIGFDAARTEGVLASFTRVCGLPEIPEEHRNTSPSVNCALVLMQLNRAGKPFEKKKIMRAFGNDKRKLALGRSLRREILDAVAEGNRRLEAEYGIRFSDEMPEEQDAPVTAPDPKAVALAMGRLSVRLAKRAKAGSARAGKTG